MIRAAFVFACALAAIGAPMATASPCPCDVPMQADAQPTITIEIPAAGRPEAYVAAIQKAGFPKAREVART